MPTREIMEALQAALPTCSISYHPDREVIHIDYRMGAMAVRREVSWLTLETLGLPQAIDNLRYSLEHDIAQEAVRAFRAGERLEIHPALRVESNELNGMFSGAYVEHVRRMVEDQLRAAAYPYISANIRVQPPAFIDEMKIDLGYGCDMTNLLKPVPKPIPSRLARIPYDE